MNNETSKVRYIIYIIIFVAFDPCMRFQQHDSYVVPHAKRTGTDKTAVKSTGIYNISFAIIRLYIFPHIHFRTTVHILQCEYI